MNDIIHQTNINRFLGAKLKRESTEFCAIHAASLKVKGIGFPVKLKIVWYEKDIRRDIDNVAAGGTKMILDGLVNSGVLKDDSRRYVKEISHFFPEPDKVRPRVEIELETIEQNCS